MRSQNGTPLLNARDASDLARQVAALDIHVPERHLGGRKEPAERWNLAHLLATLPANEWVFPLAAVHGDRPDLLLTDGRGELGIECVEAVAENDAHASVLRGHGHGPDTYFQEQHSPNEPKKSAKDLIKEIKADRMTPPWYGDAPERQWAAAMAHFIERKTLVANKIGFKRCDRNWLAIYNNWNAPALKRDKAGKMLLARQELGQGLAHFDRVYILDCHSLWSFNGVGMTVEAIGNPGWAASPLLRRPGPSVGTAG